jgi:UDP-glucose 6-dehydrogenase
VALPQRRIAVFGAGYVGLVTGACFAELGHRVVVRDVLADRIEALRRGEVPIYEPGLDELLDRNRERLGFTTEVDEAIDGAEIVYVAVGTPPTYSGDADLSAVWTVIDELPRVGRRIVVVMKSTVPVGTGARVRQRLDERGMAGVGYVSNPEFTAEGTAVHDFLHPDRVVVGSFADEDADLVASLHASIDAPVVRCDVASAEMIKLAANAALMTRISFINEIANVCEATGADVVRVAEGVGLDRRIGASFLRAGIGYGGSCLVGDETVLVRVAGRTRLTTLADLYEETLSGESLEILSWHADGRGAEFAPVALLTRRSYAGDIVEVQTTMGRRVRCTPDHPFVTEAGRRLAEELTSDDWLPVAQHGEGGRLRARLGSVRESLERRGLAPEDLVAGPHAPEVASAERLECATRAPQGGARGSALRLDGAVALDVKRDVPATIEADAAFWRGVGLHLAEGRYEQRLPDLLWSEPENHERAFLAGLWLGGGSWSYSSRGPGVALEYRTVSRHLADGLLRLLGDVGIVARLEVGRVELSTTASYRIVISGARQVETLLELVPPADRPALSHSIQRQAERITPTGYRRAANAAWVRVTGVRRLPFRGSVYSLETPPHHTFVTTGGLVVSNCFPKDSMALKQLAANSGYHFQLLNAVIEVNELQKRRIVGKLQQHLGSLRGRSIALLGLAFKPHTDDMREAPSIVLAGRLLAEGAQVRAWDPVARADGLDGVQQVATVEQALAGADAAVLVTEWPELADVDWDAAAGSMRRAVLVDGRNMLDPGRLREAGFVYEGIGRASQA